MPTLMPSWQIGVAYRCIRCYARRQACPGCYRFECVAEQVDPA